MQQQQQQKWGMRESSNALYAVANAHATAITPFLRHSFGKEALGWHGFFAFVLILAIAGFNASQGMLLYLALWIIAVCWQRNYTNKLIRQGAVWHSRYPGWPALGAKFTRGNAKSAVMVVEPFFCAFFGIMFLDLGERVVGIFILCGVPSLLLRNAVQRMLHERRVQAMIDAKIEQEWLAQEYRNR